MSSPESLYSVVHARFHQAFGTPHHVEGGGEQWTLQPTPQHSGSIHVLLNGAPWQPGVWVFDPHDGPTGVENTLIVQEGQIGDLIHLIQRRLHHANRERDNSTTSHPPYPPQEA
jgi:hypothetical protein